MKVQSGHQNSLSVFQMLEGVNLSYYGISNAGFCLGSASVPRELILSTQVNADGEDVSASCMNTSVGDEKPALDIFQEKNCSAQSHV